MNKNKEKCVFFGSDLSSIPAYPEIDLLSRRTIDLSVVASIRAPQPDRVNQFIYSEEDK